MIKLNSNKPLLPNTFLNMKVPLKLRLNQNIVAKLKTGFQTLGLWRIYRWQFTFPKEPFDCDQKSKSKLKY